MEGVNGSMLTYEEKVNIFPWIETVYGEFTKSFPADYEFEALQFFHMNVKTELERILMKAAPGRTKALFATLGDFYNLFCWKTKWNEPSPHMKMSCVQLLSDLLKVGLILSKGSRESKWLNRIISAMNVFPGEKCLLYDALLLVSSLKKKYQNTYGIILRHILCGCKQEVGEPEVYFKVLLLFRRLRHLTTDVQERSRVLALATRVQIPPDTISWLQAHNFDWNVNIMGRQLMGKCFEKSVLAKLREIVFPEVCFRQSHSLEENVLKHMSVNTSFAIDTAGQFENEGEMENAEDNCTVMAKKVQKLESSKRKKKKNKDISYLNENIAVPPKRKSEEVSEEVTNHSRKKNKIEKGNKNQGTVVGKVAVRKGSSPGLAPFTKTELQLAVCAVERKKSKKRKKKKVPIDSSDEPCAEVDKTFSSMKEPVRELEFCVSSDDPFPVTFVPKKKTKVATREGKEMQREPSKTVMSEKQIAGTEESHSVSRKCLSRDSSTEKHSKKSLVKSNSPIETHDCGESAKLQNKIQLIRSTIDDRESEEIFFEDRNPSSAMLKKSRGKKKKRLVEKNSKHQKIVSESAVLDDAHNDSSENDFESSAAQERPGKSLVSNQLQTPKKSSKDMSFQSSGDLGISSRNASRKSQVFIQQPTSEKTTKKMSPLTPDNMFLSHQKFTCRKSPIPDAVPIQQPTPEKTSKDVSSQTPDNLHLSDQEACRKSPFLGAVSNQPPTPKKICKEMSSQTPDNLCLSNRKSPGKSVAKAVSDPQPTPKKTSKIPSHSLVKSCFSPQKASSELLVPNKAIFHDEIVDSGSYKIGSSEDLETSNDYSAQSENSYVEIEQPSSKNQEKNVSEFPEKKRAADFTSDEFFNEDLDEYIPCGQKLESGASPIADSGVLQPTSAIPLNETCMEKQELQSEGQDKAKSLDVIEGAESDTLRRKYAEPNMTGSSSVKFESDDQNSESLQQGIDVQHTLRPSVNESNSESSDEDNALGGDQCSLSNSLVQNFNKPLKCTDAEPGKNPANRNEFLRQDQIMKTVRVQLDSKFVDEYLERNRLSSLSESTTENFGEQKQALDFTDIESNSESVNECPKKDLQSDDEHLDEESESNSLLILSESTVENLNEHKLTLHLAENLESYSKSGAECLGENSEPDKIQTESTFGMQSNLEGIVENPPLNIKSASNSCAIGDVHIKLEVEIPSIGDSTEDNGQSDTPVNNSFKMEDKKDEHDCDIHNKVKIEIDCEKQRTPSLNSNSVSPVKGLTSGYCTLEHDGSGSHQNDNDELEIDNLTPQENFLKNVNLAFKESKSLQIGSCSHSGKEDNSDETVASNNKILKESCADNLIEMNSVAGKKLPLKSKSNEGICSSTKLASQLVGLFYNQKSPELSEDANQVKLAAEIVVEKPSDTDEETSDIINELRVSTFSHTVDGHVHEDSETSSQISKLNVIKDDPVFDSDENEKGDVSKMENDRISCETEAEWESREIKKEPVSEFENDDINYKNGSQLDCSKAREVSMSEVEDILETSDDRIGTNYEETNNNSVSQKVTEVSASKRDTGDSISKENTCDNLAGHDVTYLMDKLLARVELADFAKKDSTFDFLKRNILKPAIKLTPLKEATLSASKYGKFFENQTENLSYSDIFPKEEMASDSFSTDSSIVNSPEFASYRDFNSDSPSVMSYFKATTVEKIEESEFLSDESLYDSDENDGWNTSDVARDSPGLTKEDSDNVLKERSGIIERQIDLTSGSSDDEDLSIPPFESTLWSKGNGHNEVETSPKPNFEETSNNCRSSCIHSEFPKEDTKVDGNDIDSEHFWKKITSAVVNVGKRCDDKDFECDDDVTCFGKSVKASSSPGVFSKTLGETSNVVGREKDCSISIEDGNSVCEGVKTDFECVDSIKSVDETSSIPHSPTHGVCVNGGESSLPDATLIETSCTTERHVSELRVSTFSHTVDGDNEPSSQTFEFNVNEKDPELDSDEKEKEDVSKIEKDQIICENNAERHSSEVKKGSVSEFENDDINYKKGRRFDSKSIKSVPIDSPSVKCIVSNKSETNLAPEAVQTPLKPSLKRSLRRATISSRKAVKSNETDASAPSATCSLRRSSRRLRNDTNLNLGFDFDQLSLNSPQRKDSETCSQTSKDSSDDVVSRSEEAAEQPNRNAGAMRTTRASSSVPVEEPELMQSETSAKNYNLRSRRSVIMPGKLKLKSK